LLDKTILPVFLNSSGTTKIRFFTACTIAPYAGLVNQPRNTPLHHMQAWLISQETTIAPYAGLINQPRNTPLHHMQA
jgi:hypothetical protein